MTNVNRLVTNIDEAFKAFRDEKKSPLMETVTTKAQSASIHDSIVNELAKVRANIELYRAMMRRVTVPPTWRRAADKAIRKMEQYKEEWSRAEKRWRSHPTGTKSVYPGSVRNNTGVRLNDTVARLFKAIKERYEAKTRNVSASIGFVNRPIYPSTKNVGTSPSVMFGDVQKAWRAYTTRRRVRTLNASKTNAARVLNKEISTLRLNLVIFKSIRDRARVSSVSKNLTFYIKRVIDMYKTYIGHLEDAYKTAKKGSLPPAYIFGTEAIEFSKQAVRFMNFASATVSGNKATVPFAMEKRQRALTHGEVLNKYGITTNAVINLENRVNALQRQALQMKQEEMNKNLTLKNVRRQLERRQQNIKNLSDQLIKVSDAWQECERQKRDIQAFNNTSRKRTR